MTLWYVYQNQTYPEEKSGGYLWSPQKNKRGLNNIGYINMSLVKKGDIVFHGYQAKTVAISTARNDCYVNTIPAELAEKTKDTWNTDGYKVDTDYLVLPSSLEMRVLRKWFKENYESESAFDRNGNGKQVYLCKLFENHALKILDEIRKDNNNSSVSLILDGINEQILNSNSETQIAKSDIEKTKRDIEKNFYDEISSGRSIIDIVKTEIPKKKGKTTTIKEMKKRVTRSRKTDFIEKSIMAEKIGSAAEVLVLQKEIKYLKRNNREDLANKVIHISKIKGDGEGFDILSYDLTGKEKYIEVKATQGDEYTPFEITKNEINFSDNYDKQYWIYRVYNFKNGSEIRYFSINGRVKDNFFLDIEVYKAYYYTY